MEYTQQHRSWSFAFSELSRDANLPQWFGSWKGDGIIAAIENRMVAEAVAAAGLPAVNLDASRLITIPLVDTAQHSVAKLALDHFVEHGLKTLAFCGNSRYTWSRQRQRHFEEMARQAGCTCTSFNSDISADITREYAAISKWLTELPKPIGIMAAYDTAALRILDACRSLGILVPDQVAVVGVDNEELLCRLSSPPLTSITLNSKRMGCLAAGLLDRMMNGEDVPPDVHLVEPVGIVCRQSTDILAIKDPLVARALRFIREHACDGINVDDLLHEIPMSRRVLESRFKKLLARSPHKEIVRTRIRRVKELLSETELPLHIIAERTGFEHIEYLSVAFKREEGVWPSEFRARCRAGTTAGAAEAESPSGNRAT